MTLDRPVHVRFIEYMPVGATPRQRLRAAHCGRQRPPGRASDHVPSDESLARVSAEGAAAGLGALEPVERDDAPGGWGPARYYRFEGAQGTLGVISPLSHHFCGECNRLRLTADGRLRTCLFCDDELDVRTRASRRQRRGRPRCHPRGALDTKPESHDDARRYRRGSMSQIGG